MPFLPWLAVLTLLAFAAVAAIDGVWLHLWKLRLHARAASYAEHLWHTASAVLFVPTVALLFVAQPSGALLWVAIALLIATHLVEVFDVRAERESRRELGGLSRFELSIHVAAVASRTIAIAALLLAQPMGIWTGTASPSLPPIVAATGMLVTIGATAIAMLHLVLAALHCPLCCGGRARA